MSDSYSEYSEPAEPADEGYEPTPEPVYEPEPAPYEQEPVTDLPPAPVESPVQQGPVSEPVEEPVEETYEEPVEETYEEPVEESSGEPAEVVAEEPADEIAYADEVPPDMSVREVQAEQAAPAPPVADLGQTEVVEDGVAEPAPDASLYDMPADPYAEIGGFWGTSVPPIGCCVVPDEVAQLPRDQQPRRVQLSDSSGQSFELPGIDSDRSGQVDLVALDASGDGNVDTVCCDTTGSGTVDLIAFDSDGDGVIDSASTDPAGDGQWQAPAPLVDSAVAAQSGSALPVEYGGPGVPTLTIISGPPLGPSPEIQAAADRYGDQLEAEIKAILDGPRAPDFGNSAQLLSEIQGKLHSSMLNNSLLTPPGTVAAYDRSSNSVVFRES